MPMRALLRPALAVLAALAALVAAGALTSADADAAKRPSGRCPARPGTLATSIYGRVWHRGTSLYGCANAYARKPRTVRLGPWKPGTKVVMNAVSVAWTVPLTRDGVRSDRAWAASAQTGARWLLGAPLRPATATAPRGEAPVQRLLVDTEGAAWITRGGDVVLAVHSPQTEPEAVGELPTAPSATRNLLLVGSWPEASPSALAASARLTVGDGDGDECGGTDRYTLTVTPDPAAPRVGASWFGGWARNC